LKPAEVHLVESRRAHNICIELSGVQMAVADIRAALLSMQLDGVSTDALAVLQRAVPTGTEKAEIAAYLQARGGGRRMTCTREDAAAAPSRSDPDATGACVQGRHPKHRGVDDPARLGTCERYFAQVMDIPHLQARLDAVHFTRVFESTSRSVRHHLGLMNTAAAELRGSRDFKLLLQHVLAVGNCMNTGTSKGAAQVRSPPLRPPLCC